MPGYAIGPNTLQWRNNGRNSVSNHQPHDCLLNRLFRRRSKKASKLRATGLYAGNSPGTGEFPAQMASRAENVSIWWRHQDNRYTLNWCAVTSSVILIIEAEWIIYELVNLASNGSNNGLSPVRRQANIWTNAASVLIGPLGNKS